MGKEGQDCDKIHNFQVYRNYTMYIYVQSTYQFIKKYIFPLLQTINCVFRRVGGRGGKKEPIQKLLQPIVRTIVRQGNL